MTALAYVTTACAGCGACLLTCPEHAIRPEVRPGLTPSRLIVVPVRCTGCGECVEVCPADAIGLTPAAAPAAAPPPPPPTVLPGRKRD